MIKYDVFSIPINRITKDKQYSGTRVQVVDVAGYSDPRFTTPLVPGDLRPVTVVKHVGRRSIADNLYLPAIAISCRHCKQLRRLGVKIHKPGKVGILIKPAT